MKNYFLLVTLVAMMFSSCSRFTGDSGKLNYRIIETQRMVEDSGYYSISLSYPLFQSEDEFLSEGLEKLNGQIVGFLDTAATYYWGSDIAGIKKIMDETEAAGNYVLDNKFEILDTVPDLISLRMDTYSFALGAHGFTAIHTWNFDLSHQKFLEIEDILDLSSNEKISRLNALLKKYFKNPEDCFNDLPTAGKGFELFGLQPGSVVFYYEAYELGAYYCGMAQVEIPVEELKNSGLWIYDQEL